MAANLDHAAAVRARSREENFPVALRMLPAATREQLLAVYGVARRIDDAGDEGPKDRLAELDALEDAVRDAAAGRAREPVFARLVPVLARLECGPAPFYDLLEANRMDQRVGTYATFEDLRAYCMLSAAPIGRIVLSIFGAASPDRVAASDDVCVALQLVEHLQDVGEDARRGRVYLPQADLAAAECERGELLADRASAALRRVVAIEASRARDLLGAAAPLVATLPARASVAVAGFAGGGHAALDAIEAAGFDVLANRCRPTRARVARHLVGLLLARPGRRRWS